jgi:preprotein translocase subunit SecA
MTGTAESEEAEFGEIYKLDVVVIPTNRSVVRNDMNDLIFRTKRAKYNAVVQEIEKMRGIGRPVLVGTTSVEVSETISRMLQRAKIPHSVLNAKQHEREAEIVAAAGQKGAVTIATNMAGRGTDIKLGPGVKDIGGLHILGTERHEARRIDRQLRGRAGRQGDPGSSQFFISLEDDLMRLFGGERITAIMDKIGAGADEVLEHPWLNKSVERAQKKVEENNFAIRKRLLDYDGVMNQQREVIYDRRRHALHGERLKSEIIGYVDEFIDEIVEVYIPDNLEQLKNEVRTKLLFDPVVDQQRAEELGKDGMKESLMKGALDFYQRKEEQLGSEFMGALERHFVLNVIDEKWREHLRAMDELKEGIYLRAYGQRDPLVEYKKEAFELFQQLIGEINTDVVAHVFRYYPEVRGAGVRTPEGRQQQVALPREQRASNTSSTRRLRFTHANAAGLGLGANPNAAVDEMEGGATDGGATATGAETGEAAQRTVVREGPKIGRNDPCYCGSGKKYKHCHGRS